MDKTKVNNYQELLNCIEQNKKLLAEKYGDRLPKKYKLMKYDWDKFTPLGLDDDDLYEISRYYDEMTLENVSYDNEYADECHWIVESYLEQIDEETKVNYALEYTDYEDLIDYSSLDDRHDDGLYWTPITELDDTELIPISEVKKSSNDVLVLKGELND